MKKIQAVLTFVLRLGWAQVAAAVLSPVLLLLLIALVIPYLAFLVLNVVGLALWYPGSTLWGFVRYLASGPQNWTKPQHQPD